MRLRTADGDHTFGRPHRDGEPERASLPGLALAPDPPAVQLDEAFRQSQPESGALARALGIATHLAELFEYALPVVGGDPDAGIPHGDLDLAVPAPRRDADPATVGCELHRVRNEIQNDLLQLARIRGHRPDIRLDLDGEPDVVVRGALTHQSEGAVDDVQERE